MKIEKEIPIPPAFSRGRSKWDEVNDQLEVGDSIFFATEREFHTARNALANREVKITTRRVDGGFRIWCVDKEG